MPYALHVVVVSLTLRRTAYEYYATYTSHPFANLLKDALNKTCKPEPVKGTQAEIKRGQPLYKGENA